MFGFVTFVYPETVKLILAKGNPHFICDARVLVKPYKEKGKVPDKYRHALQTANPSLLVLASWHASPAFGLNIIFSSSLRRKQHQGDFSGCTTPTGLDASRDPFDFHQLGNDLISSSTRIWCTFCSWAIT
jgi:hypothetical protein